MEELKAEVSKVSPIFLVPLDLLTEEKIEELAETLKVDNDTLDTWKAIIRRVREYGTEQYNEGYDEGRSVGYNEGHDEGHCEGKREGYEEGERDGTERASERIRERAYGFTYNDRVRLSNIAKGIY